MVINELCFGSEQNHHIPNIIYTLCYNVLKQYALVYIYTFEQDDSEG